MVDGQADPRTGGHAVGVLRAEIFRIRLGEDGVALAPHPPAVQRRGAPIVEAFPDAVGGELEGGRGRHGRGRCPGGATTTSYVERRRADDVAPSTHGVRRRSRERLAVDAALGRNDTRARHARLATNDADQTGIGAHGV